jgi:acetyl/propionyl-CoA carboxylase alpha subunit
VGYRNAGTVEFLLEGRGDNATFYFLEMNTRLQVEHAITEAVVGVDIVRAQLLIASGEPLPWAADTLSQRGHAIEARVYAEDPAHGFLPQAGRLLLYREPQLPGVRIDAGVEEGGDVSIHYDPMLAKVIATAETRAAAIARLASALRSYPILGVRTNVPFLLRLLEHPAFLAGEIDVGFLDRDGAGLAEESSALPQHVRDAIGSLADTTARHETPPASAADPWRALRGWRT